MKHTIAGSLILLGICSLFFIGCSKDEDVPSPEEVLQENLARVDTARLKADIAIIDDSLEQWSITALTEPNGVRYTIDTQGSGPKPTLGGLILVNYKGKLLKNNSVFDQGASVTMQLSNLILGWQTTLPLINKGSKVTLYIPSGLAYATGVRYDPDGNVLIPANSNLIFEIEILDVR